MIIRPKHYLIFITGLALSSFIFWVNNNWGNPIVRSFYLSSFTFLIWWCCWALYWELRDYWQFRWYGKHIDYSNVEIIPISIPIKWENQESSQKSKKNIGKEKNIYGEILHWQFTKKKSPVVIFSHGFSDDSLYIRHYTIPIALAGYDTVVYDCRGTQKSRSVGNKNQFAEITRDLGDIINFVQNDENLGNRPIFLIGISLGAVASIRQGIEYRDKGVEKVIASATIGNYLDVLPCSPIPFKKKWWVWLRYNLFGVPINPLPELNFQISPLLQLKDLKEKFANENEWITFINKNFFLIHAKNDNIIDFIHFAKIKELTKLNEDNWMVTKRGGHNFLRYELPLIITIISKLNL